MMEETFGPVIGIMKVEGDEEALQLMNDSPYGLVSLSHLKSELDRTLKLTESRRLQFGHHQMINRPCKSSKTSSKSSNSVQSTSTDLMRPSRLYHGVVERTLEGVSVLVRWDTIL